MEDLAPSPFKTLQLALILYFESSHFQNIGNLRLNGAPLSIFSLFTSKYYMWNINPLQYYLPVPKRDSSFI